MEERGLPFSRIRLPRDAGPHRIAFAKPAYPDVAFAESIEGAVLLDAVIGRDGTILELSVQTGHPKLAEAALEAVRHWCYRPTKVNGIAVEVKTEIEVTFTLPDSVVSS